VDATGHLSRTAALIKKASQCAASNGCSLRDVEPWAALASRGGAASRNPLVHAAWRSLLLCHPARHDLADVSTPTKSARRRWTARLDEASTTKRSAFAVTPFLRRSLDTSEKMLAVVA